MDQRHGNLVFWNVAAGFFCGERFQSQPTFPDIERILHGNLGHAHGNVTHWYIRLTAETYPHIRQICEDELGDIYSNIKMQWEDGGK